MLVNKIFKIGFDLIFVVLIVILALYFVLRLSGKAEIYEVETGSMGDSIHVGDYILIYKKNEYKKGDIVTYTKDNYYVTHRIVKKEGKKITTKGDANNTSDEPITTKQIVGKVVYIGGILNVVINYKYVLAAGLLALYLLSCFLPKNKES